jgi:hypothetical protein
MRRYQLFEIEDQPWCPASVRDCMTDYLQFMLDRTRPYAAALPLLRRALEQGGARLVVDLCAGGGGPWQQLLPVLARELPELRVCLTDRYPNLPAWRLLIAARPNRLIAYPRPVDATAVPPQLRGFRTLFSAFHHFPPALAEEVLADAVRSRQSIGVFEATQRSPLALLLAAVVVIPAVLLVTPLLRPFRWSRLLLTYVLPLIPLFCLFDGLVSCLRSYTPEELRAMASAADPEGRFTWEIGALRVPGAPLAITYLVGQETGRG